MTSDGQKARDICNGWWGQKHRGAASWVQRTNQWKDGEKRDEKVDRERGWYGSEGEGEKARGEMDRERWLCVILWTPFIYTWNKRPGLACKRLSWWGLKWNWHFQFVPWHVCLGLFTHSSASPTHAILLSTPSFSSLSLSLSTSPYSFPLPLYKPPPPSISLRLTLPCLHPPEHPQSNKEIWSRSLYRIHQTCPEKHMCILHYKYAFCTQDSFQETDASERIKDWLHSLYGKQKMINTNTWKHRKIRRSTRQHMAWMSAIISLHWGPTVWTPSIFPFLLPQTPHETTQSAWEQEHLSASVEMERTYECARVHVWMQDKGREENEQKK